MVLRSTSELYQGRVPGPFQGLLWAELPVPLEAPGKDQFGPLVRGELAGQCCLRIALLLQGEGIQFRRCSFQCAVEAQGLEVLIARP